MASGTVLGRRRRAFAAAGVAAGVLGVLVVLLVREARELRVAAVVIIEGGTALEVSVEICNAPLSVEVTESPETIEIIATRDDLDLVPGGDDCAAVVRVQLAEPVGTRTIVTRGGREVPIATVPATEVVTDLPDAAP